MPIFNKGTANDTIFIPMEFYDYTKEYDYPLRNSIDSWDTDDQGDILESSNTLSLNFPGVRALHIYSQGIMTQVQGSQDVTFHKLNPGVNNGTRQVSYQEFINSNNSRLSNDQLNAHIQKFATSLYSKKLKHSHLWVDTQAQSKYIRGKGKQHQLRVPPEILQAAQSLTASPQHDYLSVEITKYLTEQPHIYPELVTAYTEYNVTLFANLVDPKFTKKGESIVIDYTLHRYAPNLPTPLILPLEAWVELVNYYAISTHGGRIQLLTRRSPDDLLALVG